MWNWVINNIKTIGACATALTAACTGYVTAGGPVPASRQYVIAQTEQLKTRLIENSIQTNKLQLDLLRKEQFDRSIQLQQEGDNHVKAIVQQRLNEVNDSVTDTINKNTDLEKEKQSIASGAVK
jgi:hypothetical protein